MNTFMFHNVGQGLFYSGRIMDGKFQFVFDCGSESQKKHLNHAIDTQIGKEDIDFVIISHLHNDHINGLERLMQTHYIKTLYLPYLGMGNMNIAKLLIAHSLFDGGKDNMLESYIYLSSLYVQERTVDRPFQVKFIGGENVINETNDAIYSQDFMFFKDRGGPIWEFLFFNKRQPDLILAQLDQEISSLLKKYNVSDVIDLVKSNRKDEIVDIYKQVFVKGGKTLNLTSTVLIHYPTKDFRLKVPMTFDCIWREEDDCFGKKPISILTGDAEFDADMLNIVRDTILKHLDPYVIFQIPHHGSVRNWNLLPLEIKFAFSHYVITYGLGNKHHHPHPSVISELSVAKINDLSLVNQINAFFYYIY